MLRSFLKVSEIIELTLNFLPERDVNKKTYSLLLDTLQVIERNRNENFMAQHYKIKLLDLAGFAPKLNACGRCGKDGQDYICPMDP